MNPDSTQPRRVKGVGMTRTMLPVDTARMETMNRVRDQAVIAQLHLNHMHHTEPPAWTYITDDELQAIDGAMRLVVMTLASIRQRANVDNGPYSGRTAD